MGERKPCLENHFAHFKKDNVLQFVPSPLPSGLHHKNWGRVLICEQGEDPHPPCYSGVFQFVNGERCLDFWQVTFRTHTSRSPVCAFFMGNEMKMCMFDFEHHLSSNALLPGIFAL